MLEALYHLIPGYSFYNAQNTIRSDEPFAIKVRDATMGTTISGIQLIIATEHAMKIQAATGSAPGGLARSWLMWQRVLPAVLSPVGIVAAATVGLVLYTGMNEPTRTDTSLRVRPQHSEYYRDRDPYQIKT